MACGDLIIPQSGVGPVLPALEAQSLNHWTTREVPWKPWHLCAYRRLEIRATESITTYGPGTYFIWWAGFVQNWAGMYLRQNSLVPTIHFGSCKHLHFCLLTGGNSKEVKPLTDRPAIKSVKFQVFKILAHAISTYWIKSNLTWSSNT